MIGVSPLSLISSMAALLAPLLSIVTFSGTPLAFMAFSKKRRAAALSRLAVAREVDRPAFLVHRAVEIFPGALDQDAGLVHAPAAAHRALVLAEHFLQQGQKPDRPAVDRGMVDKHAALLAIISSRWR